MLQIFTLIFAIFAAAINHVAAHRISTHSIDMSGSSSIKEENQEEEARRRIDELTDFGAQAIHRGNLVRKEGQDKKDQADEAQGRKPEDVTTIKLQAASLSENVSQSSTDEPAIERGDRRI